MIAHQGKYEERLTSRSEGDDSEPAYLRLVLPLQSEAVPVSIRASAQRAMEQGDWAAAETLYALGYGWLQRLQEQEALERERAHEQIDRLAQRAEHAIADDRLTTPAGDNAAEWLQQARELDPDHPEVSRLYGQVVDRYEVLSRQALQRGNFRAARSYVARVQSLSIPEASRNRFTETSQRAAELARRESVSGRMEAAVEAGRRGEIEAVRVQLAELRERAPDDPRLDQIEARYRVMLHQPGRVFSEDLGGDVSVEGLRMIVGPRGEFMVGSERPRFSLFRRSRKHEEPRHEINIQYPYAVSQTEVTVGQFRAFVEATGYQTDAERAGFSEVFTAAGRTRVVNRTWRHDWLGREAEDNHPVIHVSWNDAQAFAAWLSRQTRNRYRLPSEAEFEALARSMREGDFYWSEDNGPEPFSGNYSGGRDQPPLEWGGDGEISVDDELAAYEDGSFGPAAVARYPANDFGFNDLIGNVSEWTQDCAHEDHSDSPADGRPRESSGDCQRRVVRGGSWMADYEALRLSHRQLRPNGAHDSTTGFRVAMDFQTERGDQL
ncbi:MAG: SUMF1/EgtB/PvdO family nonheme iron enzyme [Xanthomonadales bacterium]|nr:SUMF1/EgtB/PvdO family nonheme iron enzyme [Xanthomonadales bacterium]